MLIIVVSPDRGIVYKTSQVVPAMEHSRFYSDARHVASSSFIDTTNHKTT